MLKVTKNQGFTVFSEDTFFEKLQGVWGWGQIDPCPAVLRLNYLIDPMFTTINWLLFLSFKKKHDRTYYTPSIEIKDFNVLTDGESFMTLL